MMTVLANYSVVIFFFFLGPFFPNIFFSPFRPDLFFLGRYPHKEKENLPVTYGSRVKRKHYFDGAKREEGKKFRKKKIQKSSQYTIIYIIIYIHIVFRMVGVTVEATAVLCRWWDRWRQGAYWTWAQTRKCWGTLVGRGSYTRAQCSRVLLTSYQQAAGTSLHAPVLFLVVPPSSRFTISRRRTTVAVVRAPCCR